MALMLPITGCGGGGSDSSSTIDASGTGDTGTVALLLPDEPTDDYDHIWITVSKATLLSEEDAGELIAAEDVPAGLYAKIRLEVEAVRGVTVQPDGSTKETPFKLSSGKIDLNPRGQFYVEANTTIAITFDIDCDKSIHISGNHINFRPVFFVNIESAAQLQRCPRFLHGTFSAPGDIRSMYFS